MRKAREELTTKGNEERKEERSALYRTCLNRNIMCDFHLALPLIPISPPSFPPPRDNSTYYHKVTISSTVHAYRQRSAPWSTF